VTAYAVEFLVEFRGLLQERINATLRSQFHSFHPGELTKPLSQLLPTDLGKLATGGGKERVIGDRLLMHLRDHRRSNSPRALGFPEMPEPLPISFYSAILYGPPAAPKTFLAKGDRRGAAMAVDSLSPADFLAGGQNQVEARATGIFDALAAGSRLVYFFERNRRTDPRPRQADQSGAASFQFLNPELPD